MTIYLFDTDQEMMDACEWMLNTGKELKMYPANPNFWCLDCGNKQDDKGNYENLPAWVAFPMKHSNLTKHNIARAEPRGRK